MATLLIEMDLLMSNLAPGKDHLKQQLVKRDHWYVTINFNFQNLSKGSKPRNKPGSSNKRSFYDSQKVGKPMSLENTENLDGIEFHKFLNDNPDPADQEMVGINNCFVV